MNISIVQKQLQVLNDIIVSFQSLKEKIEKKPENIAGKMLAYFKSTGYLKDLGKLDNLLTRAINDMNLPLNT